MNLRMLELIVPSDTVAEAHKVVEDDSIIESWVDDTISEDRSLVRFLVDATQTESISDKLSEHYDGQDGFRMMLFSVEATMPQPEQSEKEKKQEEENKNRISREELYSDVTSSSELDGVYMAMVALSTVVAGAGLIMDDVATIIGAMVIAPLLTPNVSLALASTLGDLELGWRSLKSNAAGLGIVLIISFVMGLTLSVDIHSSQLTTRTMVNLKQILIALGAGSAGVLAFTRGTSATIVGVMVAVALLPPLVDVGLLLGAGYLQLAVGAGILTITNLICINLAGVATLLIQGVGPRGWHEEEEAKKSSRIAIAIWLVLLVIFGFIIWYWGQFDIKTLTP